MKTTRVLSLLPVIGDPRHAKRITMLRDEGFEVAVAAFSRPYHKGRMLDGEVSVLGQIEHGRYLSRALKMVGVIPALRRKIKDADVVYAFGPDLGILAHVAGLFLGRPVILDVADIRKVQVAGGVIGTVVRALDRICARRAALLVVTAEGFAREYYGKSLGVQTAAMVIENKLEPGVPRGEPRKQTERGITFGYFGMLRCRTSWDILEALAAAEPTVSIVVAGVAFEPADIEERISRLPNVRWLGEYRSPGDLPKLYSLVDMIWAAPFPGPEEKNWRWARANRFYEACHFCKPLIVYEGSGDGTAVRRYDIGIEIGGNTIEDNVLMIRSISRGDIEKWSRNMGELPASVYTYTDESKRLAEALNVVGGRRNRTRRSGSAATDAA